MPKGPSLLDRLWGELENQVRKLLALEVALEADGNWEDEANELRGQRGHCLGLAKAIAIVLNPYDPDVNAVRREVMRRLK